ncbi:MAG TPA: adenylate/guanylate cyclase domain-containing protein [Thermoleophilaceae bacterium]|nr:adenylate/guanylate cyclase domain-containing protein [Thermoleophilaceae bacterium]
MAEEENARQRQLGKKMARGARRIDEQPILVKAAQRVREVLPGDRAVGDPLSTAANRPADVLARYLSEVTERPSTLREVGLAAVQVYQSMSEAQGRGRGSERCAIMFTDLVEFSAWALEAGDEEAVQLLRDVALAVEPAIDSEGGRVVKRLGDGHMAVFGDAGCAVRAAHEANGRLAELHVDGYEPRIRAGVHVGQPRKLGGDYLGVDVNIAARLTDAASAGQVFVSEAAREEIGDDGFEFKKQRRFRAKGAPKDLEVYAVRLRG